MEMRFRRSASLLLILVLLLSLSGCGIKTKHTKTYYTWFDTVTTVIGYDSGESFEEACAILEDTLDRYHRACDIYHEYAGLPNACVLNRLAGNGPVQVSPELLEVLAFGQKMHSLTNGMCNIAMGAVFSLWHDCRETALSGGVAAVPEDAALLEAAAHCRIEDIVLDMVNGTAELRDPELRVDLGAVGKGYAAEQTAEALEAAGFTGYALNLGGNVRTIGGKSPRSPWIAGIQDPHQDSESVYLLKVSLTDASLVTSGSYQRFYEVDGVRYHHIISPETLRPRSDYLSVSVLTRDSGLADALSTALFNMDLEVGYNYVNQSDGVEACWILANGDIRFSRGFREYVTE